MGFEILKIRQHPELKNKAAEWFSGKWDIPVSEYSSSMEDCIQRTGAIPQWYVALCGNAIAGGYGVIENDFHERHDLAPNLCALYVEPTFRGRGLAGQLLEFALGDMRSLGVETLYLVTEHRSFYERYGWDFMCLSHGGDGCEMRLYAHRT